MNDARQYACRLLMRSCQPKKYKYENRLAMRERALQIISEEEIKCSNSQKKNTTA